VLTSLFTFLTVYLIPFIVVLGFLVFIHELGHYLAARHVGVRVERFSVGFPPRAFGRTIGETEYVLSWIPLGGYVRLFGQNLDDEDTGDPRNYAAKSIWQRAYILVAGPAMNLIAAVLIISVVYMLGVESRFDQNSAPQLSGIAENSPAAVAGLEPGDRVLSIDGTETPTWKRLFSELESGIVGGDPIAITVARQGRTETVFMDPEPLGAGKAPGWRPLIPAQVGGFSDESPARSTGMKPGDRIISIDGAPIGAWSDVSGAIQRGEGKPLAIVVERESREMRFTVIPRHNIASGRWMIGITSPVHLERYGPVDAFLLGSNRLIEITGQIFVFLGRCLSLNCSMASLGGPIKIGAIVGEATRSGLVPLLLFTAIISLQLGILNLLPIPALDGGHLLLVVMEGIKRSPLSPRLRERTQKVGLSLLIMLMLVVIFNDLVQMFSFGASG